MFQPLFKPFLTTSIGFLFGMLCAPVAQADIALNDSKTLSAYGDMRLRVESDTKGKRANGAAVKDRTRARVRVRTGLKYTPNNVLTFDVRARTGSLKNHQSPHITLTDFDGGDVGDQDVMLDKWYVGAKKNGYWGWAGRNVFPFWSHDEIFWDEDATLLGAAGGRVYHIDGGGHIAASLGAFTLPVGMNHFAGYMIGGESHYVVPINTITYSIGGGLFDFMPDREDRHAARLLDGNGSRKYTIATINAKAEKNYRDIPVMVEADILYNLQDYSSNDVDPFTAANHDQRLGYVLSTQAGDLKSKGQWMAAYYYAYIESLAVNSTYAQDEWTRWGGGSENRSNNMKGHQLNFGYAFTDNMNVLARLYLVESITTRERGDRFRVDINYKF